jgi:hypothetical protein
LSHQKLRNSWKGGFVGQLYCLYWPENRK